ncbi:MAG: AI-2E family transporter [Nitrospirae bacterium]|nr:AI-2E family transporter [Nitrospirota bacterium]MDA1305477.1 AI-2E family transporter [Nitrospirota bacterium]
MNANSSNTSNISFLATAGWLIILIAGMRAGHAILVPLLLSMFLAIICAGPMMWLENKRVPSGLAVLLVMLGVLGLGVAMGAMIGTSVDDFSQALPRYEVRLQQELGAFFGWLQSQGIAISTPDLLAHINPGAAMQFGAKMLSGLGGIFTNSFLILMTVIFMLLESSAFRRKLQLIWGSDQESSGSFGQFAFDVQHLLAIKTAVSIGTGLVVGIWVAILGVDFPVLWGLLAFLLNYIPNLGSIIAGAPAVLLALIQFGVGRALMVAAGYVVVNIVFGNVVEPKLMGQRLGLSTLTVFLSLVFWGWVWGPVGMILSVPLTMVVKIALESREDTRWIALLLASDAAVKEAALNVSSSSQTEIV